MNAEFLEFYANLVRASWIITWIASTAATVLLFRSCRSGFAILALVSAGTVLTTWIIEETVFLLRRVSENPFLESIIFRINGPLREIAMMTFGVALLATSWVMFRLIQGNKIQRIALAQFQAADAEAVAPNSSLPHSRKST